MRKKIWRGERFHDSDRVTLNPWTRNENCTVIIDSAYFPVKEAMALCKEMERMTEYGEIDRRQWAAISKYLRAVERLKKKARIHFTSSKPTHCTMNPHCGAAGGTTTLRSFEYQGVKVKVSKE